MSETTTLRDELRKAADKNRERPDWTKTRMPTITNPSHGPEHMHSWAELMEILDEQWPADFFPTLEDDPMRDAGARIVSLLRWVDMLRVQS